MVELANHRLPTELPRESSAGSTRSSQNCIPGFSSVLRGLPFTGRIGKQPETSQSFLS